MNGANGNGANAIRADAEGAAEIAVLVDYENLARGVHEERGPHARVKMRAVMHEVAGHGRIVCARAYCDWRMFRFAQRELGELGVEMIDIPELRGKNSADIQMVVDAIDIAIARRHIGTFVLITGDSDFLPLARKLREYGRRVVGIGARCSTASRLVNVCDEFIMYDEAVEMPPPLPRGARERRAEAAPPAEAAEAGAEPEEGEARGPATLDEVRHALRRIATRHGGPSGWLHGSAAKQILRRSYPDFRETDYGAPNLARLLERLAEEGIVEIEEAAHGDVRIRAAQTGLAAGAQGEGGRSRRGRRGGRRTRREAETAEPEPMPEAETQPPAEAAAAA